MANGDPQQDFLTSFAPRAQEISSATGLPLEYILAQAGLESNWGQADTYTKNNNPFGIGSHGPIAYKSLQEGTQAYIDLMGNQRYGNVARDPRTGLRTGTPQQIGDAMAAAGYNPAVAGGAISPSYGARIGSFASRLPPNLTLASTSTAPANGLSASPTNPIDPNRAVTQSPISVAGVDPDPDARFSPRSITLPGPTPNQLAAPGPTDITKFPAPAMTASTGSGLPMQPPQQMDMSKFWTMAALQSLLPKGFAFHPVDYDPTKPMEVLRSLGGFRGMSMEGVPNLVRSHPVGFDPGGIKATPVTAISPAGVPPALGRRRE